MKFELYHVSKDKVISKLDYQKNLHFCLDNSIEYDSLDFQVFDVGTLDVGIMDILVLKNIDLNETYSYMAIGVNKKNIDNKQTKFDYTINCVELSKRLEYYSLTRDFSQPTINGLEIQNYEGYPNRLKMVEECKEFVYFVKDADKNLINIRCWDYIDSDTEKELSVNLGTANIPQITANNDTLKDVLDNIFSGIGAVAALEYDIDNDKIILKAHKQNIVTGTIEMSDSSSYTENKSINGYGTVANPVMQNVIGQDNLATNGTNGRSFYGEDTFFDTSTAKAVVDYPIKEVINFYISRFDNAAIKGTETEVDIAANIVYTSQKRFLEILEDNVSSTTTTLSQNNTVSFNVGDYEITGFGSEFEGIPFPFISTAKTCWENILRSYGITSNTINNNIQNWKFRINYVPITNEKVEIFKNNYDEQSYLSMTAIQPQGNMIDFKRATNTLQDMVDKTGGNIVEKSFLNKWFELGSVDILTGLKVIKSDNTLINGNLISVYTLTAEEGYYNALNVVDSMKRESAIESSINRDIIVNDFCNIDFENFNTEASPSITSLGIKQFASTFKSSLVVDSNVENGILVIKDLNYKLISAPILKSVGKDYAKIGYRANNPTIVGYKRVNDNKQAVNYTNFNGTLQNIGLSYGIADAKINNEEFNKNLPEINKVPLSVTELETLWQGNKLINLGDVGAIDIDYELGDLSTNNISGSSSGVLGQVSVNTSKSFTLPTSYLKTLQINISTNNNSNFNGMPVGDNNYVKVSFGGIVAYTYTFTKNVYLNNLTLEFDLPVFTATELLIEYRQQINYSTELGGDLNLSYNINVITQEQKEIVTEGEASTALTIKKTPNEVLGIFHGLNAIKNKRIITGQALFTKNKLYNDTTQNFYLYGSTDSYFYDNQTSFDGTLLAGGTSMFNVTLGVTGFILSVSFTTSLNLKSYAIFNQDNELVFAVNSEYDRFINDNDKIIYFTFSSKPKGLILE